jgi:hypothetical protein
MKQRWIGQSSGWLGMMNEVLDSEHTLSADRFTHRAER